MELELFAVSDVARLLNTKTCRVNYIILKHRIDPDGVIANRVKVYRREKVHLMDEYLQKMRRKRGC